MARYPNETWTAGMRVIMEYGEPIPAITQGQHRTKPSAQTLKLSIKLLSSLGLAAGALCLCVLVTLIIGEAVAPTYGMFIYYIYALTLGPGWLLAWAAIGFALVTSPVRNPAIGLACNCALWSVFAFVWAHFARLAAPATF